MSNTIPTAESMLDISFSDNKALRTKISGIMVEFAKMHVEAALKVASEEAQVQHILGSNEFSVHKDSILNSYNLDNIK